MLRTADNCPKPKGHSPDHASASAPLLRCPPSDHMLESAAKCVSDDEALHLLITCDDETAPGLRR